MKQKPKRGKRNGFRLIHLNLMWFALCFTTLEPIPRKRFIELNLNSSLLKQGGYWIPY